MDNISFFTEEQEASIPALQTKWQNIAISTESIDRDRATAALKEVYAVMNQPEPEIVFCASPHSALERLKTYVSQVEKPQANNRQSPEEIFQGFNFAKVFVGAIGETIRQNHKRQQAKTKVVLDLVAKLLKQPSKSFVEHIDNVIPQNITTQEIVEQSFLGATPLFLNLGKQQARKGEPDLLKTWETKQSSQWQESFAVTASNIEEQLAWLPGKKFLFRQWLKNFLHGAINAQITGIEHPKLKETFYAQLSFSQRKFLAENPPIITSDLAINCILLDFYFSSLNYSHDRRKWQALQNLVQSCGWIFAMGNF